MIDEKRAREIAEEMSEEAWVEGYKAGFDSAVSIMDGVIVSLKSNSGIEEIMQKVLAERSNNNA